MYIKQLGKFLKIKRNYSLNIEPFLNYLSDTGNVNIKDKNGVLTKKGDSMLKSQINKFDTFIFF